jgi:hypothetical protein
MLEHYMGSLKHLRVDWHIVLNENKSRRVNPSQLHLTAMQSRVLNGMNFRG